MLRNRFLINFSVSHKFTPEKSVAQAINPELKIAEGCYLKQRT